MVTLDEATHIYRDDSGRELLSVTTIIQKAGLMQGEEWYTAESRDRGLAVHAAAHYLDEGDLDMGWLERSPYAGYVRSWQGLKAAMRLTCAALEQIVWNDRLLYAGRFDRLLKQEKRMSLVLGDFKTGVEDHWHAIQSAAYCATFPNPRAYRRWAIYLKKDGSPAQIRERDPMYFAEDWNTFVAARTVMNPEASAEQRRLAEQILDDWKRRKFISGNTSTSTNAA